MSQGRSRRKVIYSGQAPEPWPLHAGVSAPRRGQANSQAHASSPTPHRQTPGNWAPQASFRTARASSIRSENRGETCHLRMGLQGTMQAVYMSTTWGCRHHLLLKKISAFFSIISAVENKALKSSHASFFSLGPYKADDYPSPSSNALSLVLRFSPFTDGDIEA